MSLRIDVSGLPAERVRFAASPLAELTAMLHVLTEPGHHPQVAGWADDVWLSMPPELAERLREVAWLWRSSQADFLVPGRPRPTLAEELDDVDRLDDERYVTAALVTTCASTGATTPSSPLVDPAARQRALDVAQARGPLPAVFAERLLADPATVRVRVRSTLERCGEAFFDAAWADVVPQLAADVRVKNDLLRRQGLAAALAATTEAVSLTADGDRIVVDKLQDKATVARDGGVTFIPTVFGRPHLVAVHTPGWHPVLQYPVPEEAPAEPVSLETVTSRLEALAHPVRLRLLRTLARSPHTTRELAHAWGLSSPEVSRHLAVMRQAGLLTTRRDGRYVRYSLDFSRLTALGPELLTAVLR